MPRGCVRLAVRVQPRAARDEIVGQGEDGTLKIRVCAPPVEGAANQRLIALVAKRLRTARSNIEVVAGSGARNKLVEVRGAGDVVSEVVRRLTGKD